MLNGDKIACMAPLHQQYHKPQCQIEERDSWGKMGEIGVGKIALVKDSVNSMTKTQL